MTEGTSSKDRHPAAVWSEMLLGQPVQDLAGRHLGVVEAVVTSPAGRLHRIGLRTSRNDYRLHFYRAEGAKLSLHLIVLPLSASCVGHIVLPADRPVGKPFRLFFDRGRRALLRTP
jgi:hypothetical protein